MRKLAKDLCHLSSAKSLKGSVNPVPLCRARAYESPGKTEGLQVRISGMAANFKKD